MSLVWNPHIGASVMMQSGTLSGNTSGASTYSGTNIVVAGGSNITVEVQSASRLVFHGASGAAAGAGTDWAITGGSITVNTSGGTISLPAYLTTAQPPGAYLTTAAQSDHSHGALSLVNLTGTSSSNGLTLSAAAPGGGAAIMVSAGTTSGNVQTLALLDSNGVSFGLNGSTVTASHNGYTGATTQFLTTAALTDHSHGALALTNVTATSASNGLSLSVAGSSLPRLDQVLDPTADKVFAMAGNHLQFQLAGGGSFSTNATRQGVIEIDAIGNYTDGADVLHIHQSVGNPVIDLLHLEAAGTGVNPLHIVAAGSTGMEINAPVYYLGGSVPMVLGTSQSNVVSNLNAFYLEGARSSQFLTTAAQVSHSHGNPTLALTNLTGTTASASNGLTLSLSGNAAQTVQPAVGLNSAGTNMTWTVNSSGISINAGGYAGTGTSGTQATFTLNSAGLALNAGAYLTTAAGVSHTHGAGPTLTGPIAATSASNGLSLNVNAIGNTTAQTNVTWTVGTNGLSLNAAGYAGTGTSATNATFTLNSLGLALSVAAPGAGGGVAVAGSGASTVTSGTLQFANLNGVSFGLNGSTMTASYSSNHSHGNPTLALTNLTGTTASASNGFTLSLAAAAPGGGVTLGSWYDHPLGAVSSSQQTNSQATWRQFRLEAPVSFTRVNVPMLLSIGSSAAANTANVLISSHAGIYTRNGSTLGPLVVASGTTTHTWASNSANYSSLLGGRFASFALATTLSAGEYYFMVGLSTTNNSSIGTATTLLPNTISVLIGSTYTALNFNEFGATTAGSTTGLVFCQGLNSVLMTNTTQTFQHSQISMSGAPGVRANIHLIFRN